jgi:hypothetical protein
MVALVTGMESKLRELGSTLSLEHRQLNVFWYVDICILQLHLDSHTIPPISLHMVKLLLPPRLKLLIKFPGFSAWTSLAVTMVTLATIVTISLSSLYNYSHYKTVPSPADQSRAEACSWKTASTVTRGIGARWDPWQYISLLHWPLCVSSFLDLLFDKRRGWSF